ncbi:hypothetical protein KSF73_00965 [Burkholderiaceae bacterium DAT-1]|nr:hypothetical protein [Burkholderiaceae bacterium DAT-1]
MVVLAPPLVALVLSVMGIGIYSSRTESVPLDSTNTLQAVQSNPAKEITVPAAEVSLARSAGNQAVVVASAQPGKAGVERVAQSNARTSEQEAQLIRDAIDRVEP